MADRHEAESADEPTAAEDMSEVKKELSTASSDTELPASLPAATDGETITADPTAGVEGREAPERGRSVVSRSSTDSQATHSDFHGGHDHQVPPHRSRSRAHSSARSIQREAVAVPRSKRRGLLARMTLMAEVTNPYDYTRRQKWMLTFIVAVAGAAAPMGSAIVLPALHDIARDFDTTLTVVNLSVSMWVLAMAIFPLWWSSFSETLGRRTIYITSFAMYLVFNVLSAISTNIGMYLVMRVFAGGAAGSVQAVGAGSIADFWEVKERGKAMGIFYLGPLCGPLIAPIIGGVMAETLGWRSVQWFLAIYGAVVLVLVVFCLPETLRNRKNIAAAAEQEAAARVEAQNSEKSGPDVEAQRPELARTTTTQSVQIKTIKWLGVLRRCLLDPLRILLYLQFPAVAISVAYGSITFASLYVLNISVQQTFAVAPYNYSSILVGLMYIPNSSGYFVSSIFGGRWVDKIMHREARKAGRYDERGKLQFRPEDRLKENAWVGAAMYPAALLVYGWTVEYGESVAAPAVANFFFGIGSMLIFAAATTMLTEFMPRKASNGIALNNFVRNILASIGTIVTEPIIEAIGNGWLFTILAIVALVVGASVIWTMTRYSNKWRVGMDARMAKVMGD